MKVICCKLYFLLVRLDWNCAQISDRQCWILPKNFFCNVFSCFVSYEAYMSPGIWKNWCLHQLKVTYRLTEAYLLPWRKWPLITRCKFSAIIAICCMKIFLMYLNFIFSPAHLLFLSLVRSFLWDGDTTCVLTGKYRPKSVHQMCLNSCHVLGENMVHQFELWKRPDSSAALSACCWWW